MSSSKSRRKKKKKKEDQTDKSKNSGELISMLDKVERRLLGLTSGCEAEEEEDEEESDDDDDDDIDAEFSDDEGDDMHAAVLMESLKILEAWESQPASLPMSQSVFEKRLLEAKSQTACDDDEEKEDDDEDSFDIDENLDEEELRWIEHVEETSQKQETSQREQRQEKQNQQEKSFLSFDLSDCDNSTYLNACAEMMSQYDSRPQINSESVKDKRNDRTSSGFIVQSVTRGHDDRGLYVVFEREAREYHFPYSCHVLLT